MATRVFVGNLPIDIKERELEDLFSKYGKIRDIDIKNPSRPPAFAFITFDDARDADDAIYGRDGYSFDGMRLRVEISKGDRARFGGRDDDRDNRGGGRRGGGGGGRRTDYGVIVTNLPRGTSWQDLKDFMRKAGDVVFTDVDRNGEGIVEFSNRDDMERAVDKLDDEEFRGRDGSGYIRVKFANKRSDRSRSRSKSRSYSRSRSRDKKRSSHRDDSDNEKDKRRDRSYSRSRSKSASRSRSRSPYDNDKEDKVKDDDSTTNRKNNDEDN